jgi:chromosome segregation ATPase
MSLVGRRLLEWWWFLTIGVGVTRGYGWRMEGNSVALNSCHSYYSFRNYIQYRPGLGLAPRTRKQQQRLHSFPLGGGDDIRSSTSATTGSSDDRLQTLQKEKLELWNEFESYKVDQYRRELAWTSQVRRLTEQVQELQQHPENDADKSDYEENAETTIATRLLRNEKVALQNELDSYIRNQNNRDQEWECQVQALTQQVQDLLQQQQQLLLEQQQQPTSTTTISAAARTTTASDEPDVLSSSSVSEQQREQQMTAVAAAAAAAVEANYNHQLHALQLRYTNEINRAQETIQQLRLQNQKFQQDIQQKDANIQHHNDRIVADYTAKLARQNQELATQQLAVRRAQEREEELERRLRELHRANSSVRELVRTLWTLVHGRIISRQRRGVGRLERKPTDEEATGQPRRYGFLEKQRPSKKRQ